MRVDPEAHRQRALRVEVDEKNAPAPFSEGGPEVDGARRLADAALLVAHGQHPRRPVLLKGDRIREGADRSSCGVQNGVAVRCGALQRQVKGRLGIADGRYLVVGRNCRLSHVSVYLSADQPMQ